VVYAKLGIEIEETEEEKAKKLVVVCRLCSTNFTPGLYECPYLYHPEMGVHIPLCDGCRTMLRQEKDKD
jgi:hypothetical protein